MPWPNNAAPNAHTTPLENQMNILRRSQSKWKRQRLQLNAAFPDDSKVAPLYSSIVIQLLISDIGGGGDEDEGVEWTTGQEEEVNSQVNDGNRRA